ncbi:CRISPR-associated endonuclease Cas1 [Bacillus aquiflavi]|nr:CRISPR-associated endonuclease Cas1 [Bacillus aquiflavi]
MRKESERLKIFKEKKLIRDIRVNDYKRIYVHDSSTLTTDAIELLIEKEITLVYFKGSRFLCRVVGPENKNVTLRIAQVKAHLDTERTFKIAKNIIMAKVINTRTSLQRYYRNNKYDQVKKVIDLLKVVIKKIESSSTIDEARGLEGLAAKNYFFVFPLLVKNRATIRFNGRSKRPAKDEVNVLLNYGYGILRAEMTSALSAVGLDPYIGFLHRERYGRESLSLDLMEEFRSVFVDNLVLRLVNQPIIRKEDFFHEHGSIRMKTSTIKRFLQEIEKRRLTEVTHQLMKKKMTYREIFHTQALLLAKTIRGELEEYHPFLVK